jgi:hypothetical protein
MKRNENMGYISEEIFKKIGYNMLYGQNHLVLHP